MLKGIAKDTENRPTDGRYYNDHNRPPPQSGKVKSRHSLAEGLVQQCEHIPESACSDAAVAVTCAGKMTREMFPHASGWRR